MSTSHLRLKVIWRDVDVINLRVSAANDRFAGQTRLYTTSAELARMASELAGFPRSAGDQRVFKLGAGDTSNAVSLAFHSTDSLGHAVVTVSLLDREEMGESAVVVASAEAALVDRFIEEVDNIGRDCRGTANLESL
jgi:hypothetical protein